MSGLLRSARETVDVETPAAAATSETVGCRSAPSDCPFFMASQTKALICDEIDPKDG
jgi:hypothetical protein